MKSLLPTKWICDSIYNTLSGALQEIERKINTNQDLDLEWQWELFKTSSQKRVQVHIVKIVRVEKHHQKNSLNIIISDGSTLVGAKLKFTGHKNHSSFNCQDDLENSLIEIYDCILVLSPDSESLERVTLEIRECRVLKSAPYEILDKPIELMKTKRFCTIYDKLNRYVVNSTNKLVKHSSLPLTQLSHTNQCEEKCYPVQQEFETQTYVEHLKDCDLNKSSSSDPDFLKQNLLRLLDPPEKYLPSSSHSQTQKSNLLSLLPLKSGSEKISHKLCQIDQNKKYLHTDETGKKALKPSIAAEKSRELQETYYQQVTEFDRNDRLVIETNNQASLDSSLSLGHDETAQISGKLSSIDYQYMRIPRDQKALLENPESWVKSETDSSKQFANIPAKVSEYFDLFLKHTSKPYLESISCDPPRRCISKSIDQSNSSNFSLAFPQGILSQYFYIPSDQKDLLTDPNSWVCEESNFSDVYARMPLKACQDIAYFLNLHATYNAEIEQSSLKSMDECENGARKLTKELQEIQGEEKKDRLNNSNAVNKRQFCDQRTKLNSFADTQETQDGDENNFVNISNSTDEVQIHNERRDSSLSNDSKRTEDENEITQSEVSGLSHEEEPYYHRSLNTVDTSRSTSFHQILSKDMEIKSVYDSHSSKTHHENIEIQVDNLSKQKGSEEIYYQKFKSTYPEYNGSLRDFTWALVYIEWLVQNQELLEWELWDDFVRVLASQYPKEVFSRKTPITGLEFYQQARHQVLFCRKLLSPENLKTILLSLNTQEVGHFRKTFAVEPKELNQNETTTRIMQQNESKKKFPQRDAEVTTDLENKILSIQYCKEPSSKVSSDELNERHHSLQDPYQQKLEYHRKGHLHAWRQFLQRRKTSGDLNINHYNKVCTKRHCTFRRTLQDNIM